MELALIAMLVAILALFLLPGLRGPGASTARWGCLAGGVLWLGGCLGQLAALDAATSGSRNLVSNVNPFIFTGIFILGGLVLLFDACVIIALRIRQWQQVPEATEDEES